MKTCKSSLAIAAVAVKGSEFSADAGEASEEELSAAAAGTRRGSAVGAGSKLQQSLKAISSSCKQKASAQPNSVAGVLISTGSSSVAPQMATNDCDDDKLVSLVQQMLYSLQQNSEQLKCNAATKKAVEQALHAIHLQSQSAAAATVATSAVATSVTATASVPAAAAAEPTSAFASAIASAPTPEQETDIKSNQETSCHVPVSAVVSTTIVSSASLVHKLSQPAAVEMSFNYKDKESLLSHYSSYQSVSFYDEMLAAKMMQTVPSDLAVSQSGQYAYSVIPPHSAEAAVISAGAASTAGTASSASAASSALSESVKQSAVYQVLQTLAPTGRHESEVPAVTITDLSQGPHISAESSAVAAVAASAAKQAAQESYVSVHEAQLKASTASAAGSANAAGTASTVGTASAQSAGVHRAKARISGAAYKSGAQEDSFLDENELSLLHSRARNMAQKTLDNLCYGHKVLGCTLPQPQSYEPKVPQSGLFMPQQALSTNAQQVAAQRQAEGSAQLATAGVGMAFESQRTGYIPPSHTSDQGRGVQGSAAISVLGDAEKALLEGGLKNRALVGQKPMEVLQQTLEQIRSFYYLFCLYEGVESKPGRALLGLYYDFYEHANTYTKCYVPVNLPYLLLHSDCSLDDVFGAGAATDSGVDFQNLDVSVSSSISIGRDMWTAGAAVPLSAASPVSAAVAASAAGAVCTESAESAAANSQTLQSSTHVIHDLLQDSLFTLGLMTQKSCSRFYSAVPQKLSQRYFGYHLEISGDNYLQWRHDYFRSFSTLLQSQEQGLLEGKWVTPQFKFGLNSASQNLFSLALASTESGLPTFVWVALSIFLISGYSWPEAMSDLKCANRLETKRMGYSLDLSGAFSLGRNMLCTCKSEMPPSSVGAKFLSYVLQYMKPKKGSNDESGYSKLDMSNLYNNPNLYFGDDDKWQKSIVTAYNRLNWQSMVKNEAIKCWNLLPIKRRQELVNLFLVWRRLGLTGDQLMPAVLSAKFVTDAAPQEKMNLAQSIFNQPLYLLLDGDHRARMSSWWKGLRYGSEQEWMESIEQNYPRLFDHRAPQKEFSLEELILAQRTGREIYQELSTVHLTDLVTKKAGGASISTTKHSGYYLGLELPDLFQQHNHDLSALAGYELRAMALEQHLNFAASSPLHFALLLRQKGNLPLLFCQEDLLLRAHKFEPLMGINFASVQSLMAVTLTLCGLRPARVAYFTNSSKSWVYRLLSKFYPQLPEEYRLSIMQRARGQFAPFFSPRERKEHHLEKQRKRQEKYRQNRQKQAATIDEPESFASGAASASAAKTAKTAKTAKSAKGVRSSKGSNGVASKGNAGNKRDNLDSEQYRKELLAADAIAQSLDLLDHKYFQECNSLYDMFKKLDVGMLLYSMVDLYCSQLRHHGLIYEECCVFHRAAPTSDDFKEQVELLHQCLLPRPNAALVSCCLECHEQEVKLHLSFIRHDLEAKGKNMLSVVAYTRKRKCSNAGNVIEDQQDAFGFNKEYLRSERLRFIAKRRAETCDNTEYLGKSGIPTTDALPDSLLRPSAFLSRNAYRLSDDGFFYAQELVSDQQEQLESALAELNTGKWKTSGCDAEATSASDTVSTSDAVCDTGTVSDTASADFNHDARSSQQESAEPQPAQTTQTAQAAQGAQATQNAQTAQTAQSAQATQEQSPSTDEAFGDNFSDLFCLQRYKRGRERDRQFVNKKLSTEQLAKAREQLHIFDVIKNGFKVSYVEAYTRRCMSVVDFASCDDDCAEQCADTDQVWWGLTTQCLRFGDVSMQESPDSYYEQHKRILGIKDVGYKGGIDFFLATTVYKCITGLELGIFKQQQTQAEAESAVSETDKPDKPEARATATATGDKPKARAKMAEADNCSIPRIPSFELFLYTLEALEKQEVMFFKCQCGHQSLVFNPFLSLSPLSRQKCEHCLVDFDVALNEHEL